MLETKRLLLRPITLNDTERINFLVNEKAIVATTLRIPYPSTIEDTKKWIESHRKECKEGAQAVFGITLKSSNELIGVISLEITKLHEHAEMGYWIGINYWGQGFCTEAAEAVLKYGFEQVQLHKIFATHMKENIASERVMQKIGLQYEGLLKQHVKKEGVFKDIKIYGKIRE